MEKAIIHKIENYSGSTRMVVNHVPTIKRSNIHVYDNISIDGDVPKIFIGVYEHSTLQSNHKANYKVWPKYIAKTGHKRYPSESLTEFLLTLNPQLIF